LDYFFLGITFIFFRLKNKIVQYAFVAVLAALLYVVDMIVAGIPYPEIDNSEMLVVLGIMVTTSLVLLKCLILLTIVYFGIPDRVSE
jgi:hypothetical protein